MADPALVGVVGSGRLGTAIHELAAAEGLATVGLDSRRPDTWPATVDVAVDCATAGASAAVIAFCRTHGRPLVEAVSGLERPELDALAELAERTAVVMAPNLSLGNYLQHRALAEIARVLDAMRAGGVDARPEAAVSERHPVTKRDRPSATALGLAQAWQSAVGPVADVASIRAGNPVSDHMLTLTWPDQELVLEHRVGSLQAAAAGAIGLADWARTAPSGLVGAHDVWDRLVGGWQSLPREQPRETEYAR